MTVTLQVVNAEVDILPKCFCFRLEHICKTFKFKHSHYRLLKYACNITLNVIQVCFFPRGRRKVSKGLAF